MKSHIKPSRESMCTGGNESEAKPTGSSASYLVPLPSFSPLSLPCLSLPTQFPPIFSPWSSFLSLFTGYLYKISLLTNCFPLSFLLPPSLYLSCFPIFSFPPISLLLPPSLLPSGCFILSLSVGATSGSFQFQTRPAWLGERESEIIGLIPPSSQRLSRYSITP